MTAAQTVRESMLGVIAAMAKHEPGLPRTQVDALAMADHACSPWIYYPPISPTARADSVSDAGKCERLYQAMMRYFDDDLHFQADHRPIETW